MLKQLFDNIRNHDDKPGKVFVTTLIRRPVSMSGHKDYYCMAALQLPDGRWDVHRRRYMTDNLGRLRAHGHSSLGREAHFVSLEEACAKLEVFEKEHANYKRQIDKTPGDAKPVAEMAALVHDTRIAQASQAGGMPKRVILGRRQKA